MPQMRSFCVTELLHQGEIKYKSKTQSGPINISSVYRTFWRKRNREKKLTLDKSWIVILINFHSKYWLFFRLVRIIQTLLVYLNNFPLAATYKEMKVCLAGVIGRLRNERSVSLFTALVQTVLYTKCFWGAQFRSPICTKSNRRKVHGIQTPDTLSLSNRIS